VHTTFAPQLEPLTEELELDELLLELDELLLELDELLLELDELLLEYLKCFGSSSTGSLAS
jgi:hypothetical protein